MQELRTANHLLGDGPALRQTMADEGYLFFRDIVDPELVGHMKRGVMAWFEANDFARVVDDQPVHTGVDVARIGEHPRALYDTHLWEWWAFMPQNRPMFDAAFGEPAHVLPMGEYQFTWPGRPNMWTRMHQDGPYNPGVEFWVFWVPLMEIEESMGGLAIVPTPQSRGSLHPDVGEGPEASLIPFIPAETFGDNDWHRADYRPGDVLIFGNYTPHCGMPNETERIRLSIDLRAQAKSSKRPVTGVVTAAPPGQVVVAADSGETMTFEIDEKTAMPLMDKGLLGRRALVAAENGRASLVRNQRGHVPWMQ